MTNYTTIDVMALSDEDLVGLMIRLPDGGDLLVTMAERQFDAYRTEDPETFGIEIATAQKIFHRVKAARAEAEAFLRSRK